MILLFLNGLIRFLRESVLLLAIKRVRELNFTYLYGKN